MELKKGEMIIETERLETLLKTNESRLAEIKALYNGSIELLTLLGLAENKRIKAEAFQEGNNEAFKNVIKSAGGIMALAVQSNMPVVGKKAMKDLEEKFAFFKELIPLFIKYGDEFAPKNY